MNPGTKRTISTLTLFAAAWLGLRFLLPLFSPFLLGAALALGAEPMTGFLTRRTRIPRAAASAIGVSMAFTFAALVVLTLCAFLVRELGVLTGVLPDLEATADAGISLLESFLLKLSSHAPQGVRPLVEENVTALLSNGATLLNRVIRYLLSLAGSLLSHVPGSALSLGTGVLSAFLISAKLPRIRRWLLHHLSKARLRALLDAGKQVKSILGGWLAAQCKLMLVTYVIVSIGLLVLRIPYALLWGAGVALVDAFPVLGTGTVLLPWAAVCLLQGDGARAVGLLGVYTVASIIRSVLEPKLVGRHLGLDPLVTLMALYAGYRLWGIGGMLLAPLLAVLAGQLAEGRGRTSEG